MSDWSRCRGINLPNLIDKPQFHIVIRKNTLDIFANPNTDEILRLVNPQTVIVYGIALDFCVSMVVFDLLRRGKADLIVLEDAVAGLGTRPDDKNYMMNSGQGRQSAETA